MRRALRRTAAHRPAERWTATYACAARAPGGQPGVLVGRAAIQPLPTGLRLPGPPQDRRAARRGRAQPARRRRRPVHRGGHRPGLQRPCDQACRRTGRGAAADPDRAPAGRADHGRPAGTDGGVPRLRRGEGQRQQLGQRPRPGRRGAPGAVSPRRPRRPTDRSAAPPRPGRALQRRRRTAACAAARLLRAGRRHPRPATVKAIASHLAGFGRFLSACTHQSPTAALDCRAHIDPGWPRWPPRGIRTGGRTRSGTGAGRSSPSASSSPTSPSGAGRRLRPAR